MTTPGQDKDTFFKQTKCDRCGAVLKGRIMSWFTEETICLDKCHLEEKELRNSLPDFGRKHEGCGYIPALETIRK